MASKKKSAKGKRYSFAEKQSIIDFVNQYNAEHGRGGQTAAAKKYGASQLTISGWLKKGGAAATPPASSPASTPSAAKAPKSGRTSALAQLTELHEEIARRRKELDEMEVKFQRIKDTL